MDIEKKQLRRKRMIDIFLKSILEVIETEGMGKVTVRKVADIAGYNVATLYNYFENLDHLLFFAAMSYLNKYTAVLQTIFENSKNSLEMYRKSWLSFAEYSFEHPQIYYALFFANLHDSHVSYMSSFRELYPYPENKNPDLLKKMFYQPDFQKTNSLLMEQCIKDKYFQREEGETIDDIIVFTYQSLLYHIYENQLTKDIAYEKFRRIIENFFIK